MRLLSLRTIDSRLTLSVQTVALSAECLPETPHYFQFLFIGDYFPRVRRKWQNGLFSQSYSRLGRVLNAERISVAASTNNIRALNS